MSQLRSFYKTSCLAAVGLSFILFTSTLVAQTETTPIALGEQFTIQSNELNLERTVWVYLPPEYHNNKSAYPVLYMNNAVTDFHYTSAIVNFQAQVHRAPEMIVVAVVNTDPSLDFTYPVDNFIATDGSETGGADKYIQFIRNELIPHIENRYRTQPYRITVGHALGGLFSAYTLMAAPDLFNAFICMSPLLRWDSYGIIKKMDAGLKTHQPENKFFYLAVGSINEHILKASAEMASLFQPDKERGIQFTYSVIEHESHASIGIPAMKAALEILFHGWEPDGRAILTHQYPLKELNGHYDGLSKRLGYIVLPPETLLNNLGYAAMRQGNHAIAVKMFEANAINNPTSANAFDSRGDGYTAAGDFAKALESYQMAVKLGTAANNPNLELFIANVNRTRQKI